MGLGPNRYQIGKLANFMQKKIPMLTTLKVSFLTYKCVFYRPENNTKGGDPQGTEDLEMSFGGLEMQK